MNPTFDMVAKTFRGLEEVLAEELRQLGAQDVMPGNRMVSFRGDKAMLYKANMWCRTALRILKPFYTFKASDPDTLYDRTKAFDWSSLMNADKTFSIDSTVYSEEFRNSQFVTYRVKDAMSTGSATTRPTKNVRACASTVPTSCSTSTYRAEM